MRAANRIASLLAALVLPAAGFAKPPLSAAEEAQTLPLASHSLLLDIASAGKRLVAVGERGHILLSDDRGISWRQAEHVPSRALLTGVCFNDASHGIAVGHDQTILVTADAGRLWTRRHFAPQAQQPLLSVWCGAQGRAIAVGAYASYFESLDGGLSWSARKFMPSPAPDNDYHLNRIVGASPTRLYIAGEAGHLYRSDDGGATWMMLSAPYEGSFFGALAPSVDEVLVYGLRGHVFRSTDAGKTWTSIETATDAMLNDAVRLSADRIALVGLSGTILVGRFEDKRLQLLQQGDRRGLSAALTTGPAVLMTVGEGGAKAIALPP